MPRTIVLILLMASLPTIDACKQEQVEIPNNIEIVMKPGMEIWANTSRGRVGIRADSILRRTYYWDNGCKGAVELWPRKERWMGSLGIYYPGPGNTWWFSCGGVKRAVVEEGIQNFDSEEAIQTWLQKQDWIHPVHTNNGLVVGWRKTELRDQINVEVWQLLIQGNKPERLQGSQDSLIIVKTGEDGNKR